MDGQPASAWWGRASRRWMTHAEHEVVPDPHHLALDWDQPRRTVPVSSLVTLDGSRGEGGGQVLRTSLSLSLLTGRPFRIVKVRANRDKPGLRPQHLSAVKAAAELAGAEVVGAEVGSKDLTFHPQAYTPRDLTIDIGTAGSTALVLQTLHLPLAMRAERPIRLVLLGGTFNLNAPSYPFLEQTWRHYLAAMGMPIALSMPLAGFYPRGGGRLEAWIEPASPEALTRIERGPLQAIRGISGTASLRSHHVGQRMLDRAEARLADHGLLAEIDLVEWPGDSPGAALVLTAEHARTNATFVGLGARGKPAETVADEAVDELLAYEYAQGAIDAHSADQLLLPLALAEGRSIYTVAEVTEHLRTNADTIRAFLDRPVRIEEPNADHPGRVIVG